MENKAAQAQQPVDPAGKRPGLLIAFEGIDGCGKSGHLRRLAAFLREQGLAVIETREPTDGPFGRRLRALLTNRGSISREEELELFLADRRDHVAGCIAPALAEGRIVLTDRYYFSTAAYQGATGLDPDAIFAQNAFAPEPDLVLLLQTPVAESVRRIREQRGEQPNDFEEAGQLEQVARLFDSFTQPCIVRIDSTGERRRVQARIRAQVLALCRERGLTCR